MINKLSSKESQSPKCLMLLKKKRYLVAFLFTFLDGQQSKFFFSFSRAVCLTGERDLRAPFQCSTLIFLLTCPLGNYISSFTCRVYFLVAQKKSPARFVRSFIEFSIFVPSNFNAQHKFQARGHTVPLPANRKKIQLYFIVINTVMLE